MDWVKDIGTKQTLWATPGPHLRKSMLLNLARKISDRWAPEMMYSGNTFDEAEGVTTRSPDEEDASVLSLVIRLCNKGGYIKKRAFSEDYSSDSEEDEPEDEEDALEV